MLPEWVVVLTGSVLVVFAAFCFAVAVWRELYPGTPPPRPDVRRLPRALLFALNGFLALVATSNAAGGRRASSIRKGPGREAPAQTCSASLFRGCEAVR